MNRRSFIEKSACAVFGLGAAANSVWSGGLVQSGQRPNILLINADDLGWADLSFMGSSFYETPNIDRLAEQGMVFTDAYAAASNCAPSRACLYTGQYGPRHGVYTVNNSDRGNSSFRRLIPIENTMYIEPENTTFAHLLNDAGYQTIHLGKWHVSEDPKPHGFEINVGGWRLGSPRGGYFSPYRNPALEDGPEGEYLTYRLGDEALAFLEQRDRDRPFLMSLQFYTPHTPLQAKPEVIRKYRQKEGDEHHRNPTYAAMIEHMDNVVGRLMDKLDELELSANTLVVFTSDQGGLCRVTSQYPLRAGKGAYYEGGIRVPMIVRWPGMVAAGSRNSDMVGQIDLYPTFLEAAHVSVPQDKLLDGVSLLPILTGSGELEDRAMFWHFPIYLQPSGGDRRQYRDVLFRTRPGSVIRYGRYKLHEYFEDGGLELYDLENDIGERNNLADSLPEVRDALHTKLKAWREETGAEVPTELNPEFDEESERNARRRRG